MFTNNLPTIDLHGEDRVTATIKVKEFITDSVKLKHKKIVVIHGVGTGILKNTIHEYLKSDERVIEYTLDINIGQTIISLKID